MLEAREVERRRINEIISQQKKEYEAQMSLGISGNKSGSFITKQELKKDLPEIKPRIDPEPPALTPAIVVNRPITPISAAGSGDMATKGERPHPSLETQQTNNTDETNYTNKNVEIRRMSATEEGDKVLESAWD